MPYKNADSKALPEYVQRLGQGDREQWVAVFNSAQASCLKDGRDEQECERAAFAQANGVVMKEYAAAALSEAATLKAKAQALVRDMSAILSDRALPDSVRKEIEDVRVALRRTWADLEADGAEPEPEAAEEVNKTVAGQAIPASAFLVVEDPDMPSTWHLQVRDASGQPDHRLMGAAYAALTVGYRGNRYEGPDKAGALRKLRALYNAEEMAWPGEQAEAWRAAIEQVLDIINPMRAALAEALGDTETPVKQEAELTVEALGESAEGVELLSEGAALEDGQGPLTLKVKLIEPGFGNKRDGHYYPANILKRDAHVFEGAKMYETDHKDAEKSTRTWVSTVRKVVGFSDTGAPLAEVVVHDPGFARRVRNLAKSEMLGAMACSILASGNVKRGRVGDQQAKIVEAITDAQSVDWVTRAGAGGQALAIMSEAQDGVDSPRTEPERNDDMLEVEEQKPAAESEPVQEGEQPVMEQEPQAEPQPERLSEADVTAVLAEAQCNAAIKERLARGEYADADALKAAIAEEVEYVKRVTGSGKVTDMGEATKPKAQPVTLAEVEERVRQVNAKWGFGPKRQPEKVETK